MRTVPSSATPRAMRCAVARSTSSSGSPNGIGRLRTTAACRGPLSGAMPTLPTAPPSLQAYRTAPAPASGPGGRPRHAVAVYASKGPEGTPDPQLEAIALERFGKSYNQLTKEQQKSCVAKKASDARWKGREKEKKPKPEENEELQRLAQEMYGKPYEQLETSEKKACAGKKGSTAKARIVLESEDPVVQAIAQEKYGKVLRDLTPEELMACIGAKAVHARWEGHTSLHEITRLRQEGDPDLQRIAQEKYGKPFEMLTPDEAKRVSSAKGSLTKHLNNPVYHIDYAAMPGEKALEMIAQEKFGKPYEELESKQRTSVQKTKSRRIISYRDRHSGGLPPQGRSPTPPPQGGPPPPLPQGGSPPPPPQGGPAGAQAGARTPPLKAVPPAQPSPAARTPRAGSPPNRGAPARGGSPQPPLGGAAQGPPPQAPRAPPKASPAPGGPALGGSPPPQAPPPQGASPRSSLPWNNAPRRVSPARSGSPPANGRGGK